MKLTIQDGRDSFYTFDTNRILLLTATDEEQINQVEFSTEENGETVSWTSDVLTGEDGTKFVQVPNEFLNGNYSRLVCYYVALDSNGEFTRQKEIFRIRARQEPQDYYLTYSERVTFASIKALTEQYKVNASNSADLARRYAEESEDVNVETGTYSSKHWSIKSEKKFQEIKDYVGNSSNPKSALGSIESARVSAVSDVNKQKTDSIEAVGTYTSNTAIPSVSQYVESTAKPALKTYGEQQVNSYVNGTSKPELDRYVNNEKKQVLDNYTAEKKSELDNYTETDKKQVLDSYTENEKKAELDSHTAGLKEQLNSHTVAKSGELNEYTTGLKSELDGYTTAKEQDISEFTEQKKLEVQGVYQTDLNELKGDLSVLDIKNTLTWRTGYYQNDGSIDINNPFSNIYSSIIRSDTIRKINITVGDNRQYCVVYFNKDTNEFESRTEWLTDSITLTNGKNIAICVCTISNSDISQSEVLSKINIIANIDKILTQNVAIVDRNWSVLKPEEKPFYAVCKGIDFVIGDTITPKNGYECGVLTGIDSTFVPWFSSTYTFTSNKSNFAIVIRKASLSGEIDLDKEGYTLSSFIEETYSSNNCAYMQNVISGKTLDILLNECYKNTLGLLPEYNASKWKNKKIAFVGDSITVGGGIPNGNKYYQILNDRIEFSNVYVDGIAGSCYSAQALAPYTPIVDRVQNIPTDRDIIILFAGTNDFGRSTPIGTIADTTDVSFYGAVTKSIVDIMTMNPSVRLAVITPLHRAPNTTYDWLGDEQQNDVGLVLKDYVDAIKDVCERYSIPVINMFGNYGLNPNIANVNSAFFQDGLHPNTDGHRVLAERIYPILETI